MPAAGGGGHVQAQMIQLNGLGVHSGFKRHRRPLSAQNQAGNQRLSDKLRFKPPEEFRSIAGIEPSGNGRLPLAALARVGSLGACLSRKREKRMRHGSK